jgi:hypothetical protein
VIKQKDHIAYKLLDPPQEWIDIYCQTTRPELYETVDRKISMTISLSYYNEKKFEVPNSDFYRVAADLSSGFMLKKVSGKESIYYQFVGTQYVVNVKPFMHRQYSRTIALVNKIKPEARMLNKQETFTCNFAFEFYSEAASCDIEKTYDSISEILKKQRVRQSFESSVRQMLQKPPRIVENIHSNDLHRIARKRYGNLMALIEIFEQRANTEYSAQAIGSIIDEAKNTDGEETEQFISSDTAESASVLITSRNGNFERDDFIRVKSLLNPDIKFRTRVSEIIGNRLYFTIPEKYKLELEESVQIDLIPHFGMRQHSLALRRLLNEDVIGNWERLIEMLCDPKSMQHFPIVMPERFYYETEDKENNRKLNEEQKNAIVGALSTPHAFFIQGPPGTGKTTVITEIIRNLAARGERILLVAPTHVAVDEVLSRIGSKNKIFPLRVAWDEGRVRPNVRKFVRPNVAKTFMQNISVLGDGKKIRWQSKIKDLRELYQNLNEIEAKTRAKEKALEEKKLLIEEHEKWISANSDEVNQLKESLQQIQSAIKSKTASLEELTSVINQISSDLENKEANQSILGKIITFLRFGEVVRLRKLLKDKEHSAESLQTEAGAFDMTSKQEAVRLDELQSQESLRKSKFAVSLEEIEKQIDQVTSEWKSAASAVPEGAMLNLKIITQKQLEIMQSVKKLNDYLVLEKKWNGYLNTESETKKPFLNEVADELLFAINLVCATTTGIAGDSFARDADYDTLILDEASRVTDSEFLIAAIRAKRWILVGDEKQLPPYVEQADEHHLHALAAIDLLERGVGKSLEESINHLAHLWEEDEELHRFRKGSVSKIASKTLESGYWGKEYKSIFTECYRRFQSDKDVTDPNVEILRTLRTFLVRSLFERCVDECRYDMKQRLNIQRRMIEPIAAIVKDSVYLGSLLTPPPEEMARCNVIPLTTRTFTKPIVFLDTSFDGPKAADNMQGNGFINQLEQKWVVSACRTYDQELYMQGENEVTASIICFYKAQAYAIRDRLRMHKFRALKFQVIDAIDKIQGQESDIVFISFCRTCKGAPSSYFGQWLQDMRRINVACTRAHRALVFVGNKKTLEGLCSNDSARKFYYDLFNNNKDSMQLIVNYKGAEQ